jgi:segregation and condensation protein B
LIYATTKDFLEIFDLKDLKDLPTLKEIDAFGNPLSEAVESSSEEKVPSDDRTDAQGASESDTPDSPSKDKTPVTESDPRKETESSGKNA